MNKKFAHKADASGTHPIYGACDLDTRPEASAPGRIAFRPALHGGPMNASGIYPAAWLYTSARTFGFEATA
jgi:hypothetical protein